ncbi:MAG: DUF4271 domain-containing protein [Dysgonamonadaceae bacterium]|jgi:hypothetical protein|nr:DUF4271 domain-containing protein [Dysgonamonadaceae bacterium]
MIFEKSSESMKLLWEEPLSGRVQTQNMGFILFAACFFVLIYQVSKNAKLLLAMKSKLLGSRSQMLSTESFPSQFLKILLFCVQTVVLTSIVLYCKAVSEGIFQMESSVEMFTFLCYTSLLLGSFIVYKYFAYSLTSYIFFDKITRQRWNDTFSSAIGVSGVILFFPALILFYTEQIDTYGVYFVLSYFIFIQMILLYRQFMLFFDKKGGWIYFILYLCTQEIIPLFLLYKGFVYFFNIAKG